MNKSEQLIACLEGEIAKRDARIAELDGSGASKEAFAEIAFDLQTQRDQLRAELAAVKAAPVAKQVVMPERKKWDASAGTAENMKSEAYNAALDAVIRLNAADQEGGQDE